MKRKRSVKDDNEKLINNIRGSKLDVNAQVCDNCRQKFLFLANSETNRDLCFNCFSNLESAFEATKRAANMGEYQTELWTNPLPDNYEDIVKKRAINRALIFTDINKGDSRILIDHILDKIKEGIANKFQSTRNVTEKDYDDVYDKCLKIFDWYPDIPPGMKNKMMNVIKEEFSYYKDAHNKHLENEVNEKARLMKVLEDKIKPVFYKKIEKIMEMWIEDRQEPLREITDEEILSAADGAIHNVEKHKELPNGYCKICDEYYNNGSIKTKLSVALEIIDESINLYSRKRKQFYESQIKEGIIDQKQFDDEYQKDTSKYATSLRNNFQNTKQEKVDEFIHKLREENDRIKEDNRKERERKKQEITMKSWNEARSYIRKQNLFTQTDFENFSKSSDFPEDMHPTPHTFYKEWKQLKAKTISEQYKEFLGIEGRTYNFRKDPKAYKRQTTKQIFQELQERFDHYCSLTPGFLVTQFKNAGLFHHRDPGIRAFVRQFIETEKTPEGKKELYEALSRTIFNLQVGHFPKGTVDFTPIPETEKTYLDRKSSPVKKVAPLLEKIQIHSVKNIIQNAREVIPITKDTRLWNLHVEIIKNMIFKQLFDPKRELEEIEHMIQEKKNGNPFHDEVMSRFWDEYNGLKSIKFWKPDYSFKVAGEIKMPTLNQLYTAFKMRKINGFCNFSDPGTGKTNAAYLATRNPEIRRVLIIAPFNITKQWVTALENIYPHSFISIGKEPFKNWAKGDYDKYYHVINYEKFARDRGRLVNELANFDIDFVIIDESHHTKVRNESSISHTRINIEKLLDKLRTQNRKLKCLMLSATPVINNVQEGKSLLEMVTGTKYPDLKTVNNLGNATELHSEFIPFSIRYEKTYDDIEQKGKDKPIRVSAIIPEFLKPEEKRRLTWMELEQICTKARLPEIIKNLKKKTIIYTDYVGGNPKLGHSILKQLKKAVEGEGYSVGFFTGEELEPGIGGKGGLEDWSNCKVVDGKKIPFNPFVNGNLDVLIASSSIAEGIDELQYVCDNIIFNGLVWTFADFKQIIGRLVRQGQKSDEVRISLILSSLNGYDYDEKIKLNRLELKKILGNCVLDGTLPDLAKLPNTKKEYSKMMKTILNENESIIKVPVKQKEKQDERT